MFFVNVQKKLLVANNLKYNLNFILYKETHKTFDFLFNILDLIFKTKLYTEGFKNKKSK